MGEFKLVVKQKYESEFSDLLKMIAILAFSAGPKIRHKEEFHVFLEQKSRSSKKLSIEALMKELNHVVLEKKRTSSEIKT